VQAPSARWLLLIHQVQPKPDYLRVKVARRLQRIGAVAIKNTVYVLPNGDATLEDFHWTVQEIRKDGGDAYVCEARFVDGLTDPQVEELFRVSRDADYAAIAEAARVLLGTHDDRRLDAEIAKLRRRLEDVRAIDFFGAPAGEAACALVDSLAARSEKGKDAVPEERVPHDPHGHRGRTWVTRTGIQADRMASAWLIRRFIDSEAAFKYVPAKGYVPQHGEVRFDMFDGEFTHEGDDCTFEVLVRRMALADPALRPVAEIVHDIDLKDAKFDREEAAGIASLVAGIAAAHADDEERRAEGAVVFEGLYQSFRKGR
jgi:hypothetical protein